MQTIYELCKPRESVFLDTTRDDTLNLSDLVEKRIDADKFFSENFKTKGMEILFETAFKRFQGKTNTGVIKLTQAMGGGKTHNMLALALLAQNNEWRRNLVSTEFDDLGPIKVVAFSGRESDAPFGIWGSIAEQLGKKEVFADLYSPLKAPGESAWIKLLQGENILILLDELPPYLENAKAITIGNSDLCQVTITALANLFSALGKEQLSNVCLVFSDLKATYESGSELLQSSFKELESEANRSAINIEPVALNSDEIYDILKKRLFEVCPSSNSTPVNEIAIEYRDALNRANKMGLTNLTGDKVFLGIRDSYPFHPSIKELYARFKENANFQQTRGLIKLMRQIVRQFYESGKAQQKSLINVFDIDLNDRNMLSYIKQIKASLEAAISHDIAQAGKSVAELIDEAEEGSLPYAQDLSKLLLMSSLCDTAHGLQGLTDSEALGFLCAPEVELNNYKKAFEEIKTQSWYLKMDNRGRYYFQNTKNMVAEMNTLVEGYSNENAKKELRKFLEENFKPNLKKCYELLYVLPAIDEIQLDMNKIALVIFEPYAGGRLHPDLQAFYDNTPYKNRVMFLSGQRNLMEKLYQNSKRLTAIREIIAIMKAEHVPATDQQYKEAENQLDKATQALLQTIRETFVTLYFPTKSGIISEDFKLEFKENSFKGEEQIINVLAEADKFEDYQADDEFMDLMQKKCEQRLFTQKEMTWNQIKERAATEIIWQWYHPSQMEDLRKDCLKKDKWRENGGYLVKGPFAKEPTSVAVEQTYYNEETGEFTLKVRGIHGDRVYYDIGAEPTTASAEVTQSPFITKEPLLHFLCVDSSKDNPHPTGSAKEFMCQVPLRFEQRHSIQGNVLELKTHSDFEIRYTTDGSNPKESGGIYTGEILLPSFCKFVRTVVMYKGRVVEEKDIAIEEKPESLKVQEDKPLEYTLYNQHKCGDTDLTYAELEKLKKLAGALIRHFTVVISEKANPNNYMELSTSNVPYDAENLQATIDLVREFAFAGKEVIVEFDYKTLRFTSGLQFKDWIELNKFDITEIQKRGTIEQ
jgi:hypothetical protein